MGENMSLLSLFIYYSVIEIHGLKSFLSMIMDMHNYGTRSANLVLDLKNVKIIP